MNTKLALLALVALLVLAGAWFLLRGDSAGRGTVRPEPTGDAPAPAEEPAPELAAPPSGAERTEAPAREEPAAALALPVEHQSFALEAARWLDVRVILPAGLPAADQPALLGFAKKDGTAINDWEANRISEELDLSDEFAGEVEDEHHWARRPLAAEVRLPFPPAAEQGVLFLQSRYLDLEPRIVRLHNEGAIVVEPTLGGYVTGRCVFPVEAPAIDPGKVKVEFDGRAKDEGLLGFADADSRDARVRADLGFELRALSAERKYVVHGSAEGFVGHFELSFEIAPGEQRSVEILFREGATFSGVVRGDGAPLADVSVRAQVRPGLPWNEVESVATAADGSFELRGVPGGKVELFAEKDGWIAAEHGPLDVVEGQSVRGIELVLGAGRRIGGLVRWPDGEPVQEAEVEAYRTHERGWMEHLVSARSDAEGRFRLGGLADEPVEVVARKRPDAQALRGLGLEIPVPVQPGTPAARALEESGFSAEELREPAQWVACARGVAPDTADLVLTLPRPIPVPGVAVDDTGAPVAAFTLEAAPTARANNAPEEVRRPVSSPDGTFTLEVPYSGEWRFTASAKGGAGSEPVTAQVPLAGAPLRLVLPRAGSIAGLVLDPLGSPVPGASVSSSATANPDAFAAFQGGDAESDAEGRFTLLQAAGNLFLIARHEDWAASEAVPVEIAPGASVTGLVLVLRVGARITGEVFDASGRPQPDQNVNCGSGGGMAFGFGGEHSTVTDSAGRFAFEHVTPGKVTVSVVPSEEELMKLVGQADEETAFVSLFGQMRTATVEVADGGSAHVVLGTKPKEPVRVHGFVSEARSPVAGKQVFVLAEGGALLQGMKLAKTDESGRYEVELDRPGDYVFGISTNADFDGTGTQFYVEVPEVEELEQDFELPLGRILGRVLAPDGGPAVGVPLRLSVAEGMMGLEDLSDSHRSSSGEDGEFAFEHLQPGTYTLHVGSNLFEGSSGGFAQAIVDGIVVKPERTVEGIEVRLSAPGKLTGRVRDDTGAPVAGAAIFVRDSAGRATTVSDCFSDAAGRFTYERIAPGSVTVSARTATHACADGDPLEIRAGATSSVELLVAKGTFLVVSLLDGDREVRARLRVLDEAGRRVDDLFAVNDFERLFSEGVSSRQRRIGPLAPGKYTLIATALDGKDARKSLLVEAGQEERRVKLRLK